MSQNRTQRTDQEGLLFISECHRSGLTDALCYEQNDVKNQCMEGVK